jgi:plastocyanin
VTAGEPFSVVNEDDTEHTFTADDGSFDVDVPAGETVTVDALDAGTYDFHCNIHASMSGTLDVE